MSGRTPNPTLRWRTSTGRWRWLILGALGVAPNACGGRTDAADPNASGGDIERQPDPKNNGQGSSTGIATTRGTSGNGGAGGTGGSSGGGGGGGGTVVSTRSNCDPPITALGGGWERCANGMLHRAFVGACESSLPRPERVTGYDGNPVPDAGTDGYHPPYSCYEDADCTDAPNGHCESGQYEDGTSCAYGCITDSDCSAGSVCLCGDTIGHCVAATCSTDAECESGLLCSNYVTDPGCGGVAFACQLPSDACAAESDCNPGLYCSRGYRDALDATPAPTSCMPPGCAIGRPFLVDGRERLAGEVLRADWYPDGPASLDVQVACGAELRAAIVAGWTEQALMEHASIAAFARFSLQLLSLGAPPDLLMDAARAMHDETEHARACFELARRYRDVDVGPGPLPLDGAFEPEDTAAIVLSTIAEGCIGETVAAIEAAEAAARCEDEAARTVLERIAADETRHAELAWRFVAWALRTGPVSLRERARAAFDAALSRATAISPPNDFELELARHGLFGPALRQACRARVLAEVIAPSARALLETSGPVTLIASSSASARTPAAPFA